MAGLGALSAGASCALFSHDWCCTTVGAAILGAFIGGLTERVIIHWTRAPRRPRVLVRAAVVVALASSLGLFFRLDQASAFENAFGIRPPSGVHDLHIRRSYAGGPGDSITLIRFVADEATMRTILSRRQFKEDIEWQQDSSSQPDWLETWKHVFSTIPETFGGADWRSVPPMSNPKVYLWKSLGVGNEDVRLLWEPSSGRVYAMHGVG